MCQLYTASQTNLKGNRKYFTKEISYLSYISSDPFLMKPNIIVAHHYFFLKTKNIFFLKVYTYSENIVFLNRDIFLCLICVINATIFSCTHYIFKVHSEKDEKIIFSPV